MVGLAHARAHRARLGGSGRTGGRARARTGRLEPLHGALAIELAPRFRVLAPDLPGFGLSDRPAHTLAVGELAGSLTAWMAASEVSSAALVANSFGCQIAVEAARRHPESVERAVLIGPTVDPSARRFCRQVARWLRNAPREPLSLSAVVGRDYAGTGTRRVIETFRLALEDGIEGKLAEVRSPVLVVRGELDPIVSQAWAEQAARMLARGRLEVLPGAAHAANFSAATEVARAVRRFLEEPAEGMEQQDA